MIFSMTGYGRAALQYDDKTVVVELRAVNSKQLDLKIKLPNRYKNREMDLRRMVGDRLERGRIEMSLELNNPNTSEQHAINHDLFAVYVNELNSLCIQHKIPQQELLRSVLMMPNIFEASSENADDEEWNAVMQGGVEAALVAFNQFRQDEGAVLLQDFHLRNNLLINYLDAIAPLEPERIVKLRTRLETNLQNWLGGTGKLDENRLEQELIFYIEKIDITEEKTRLRQHCAYFTQELNDLNSTSKGRKLNFITQEMGREINTIGSKANHAEMQRYVVMMKDELEKIKEQINNIL